MNFAAWPAMLDVDVEGNGTNPPDPVEVAALPVRDGRPDKSTAGWWLTRPNRPVTPFAPRVHGLTNTDLPDKPAWADITDRTHLPRQRLDLRAPRTHRLPRPGHTPARLAASRRAGHPETGQGRLP
ncbi:hypothetical protein TR631_37750 [Streptomyces rochei]|uniref:hypothetical protein n=1 Tax=Streptomyces rochei TaxID=1928 RepID=UPI002ACDC613|nr:hypothetical protein [Streptomyces rochei]WQC10405.1 hypothetical protein TR631_00560 [Streptomyces rochei]WQC17270.1 hypothetical protein TR631_37750 [Streptomyces rochei]